MYQTDRWDYAGTDLCRLEERCRAARRITQIARQLRWDNLVARRAAQTKFNLADIEAAYAALNHTVHASETNMVRIITANGEHVIADDGTLYYPQTRFDLTYDGKHGSRAADNGAAAAHRQAEHRAMLLDAHRMHQRLHDLTDDLDAWFHRLHAAAVRDDFARGRELGLITDEAIAEARAQLNAHRQGPDHSDWRDYEARRYTVTKGTDIFGDHVHSIEYTPVDIPEDEAPNIDALLYSDKTVIQHRSRTDFSHEDDPTARQYNAPDDDTRTYGIARAYTELGHDFRIIDTQDPEQELIDSLILTEDDFADLFNWDTPDTDDTDETDE